MTLRSSYFRSFHDSVSVETRLNWIHFITYHWIWYLLGGIRYSLLHSTEAEMENLSGVDGGQLWLLNCLNATLDVNQEIRSSAEESLKQASAHQGFGVALAKVTVNTELPLGLRQLAAVLLKQYVKQHWQEGEKNYISPTVMPADKCVIRSLLLQALDDPHRKICTAVGMAVASIAEYDWPEEWPDLMSFLLKLISDQTNMNGVRGALKCLALFAGELDDKLLPTLVPVLFPSLYAIVSSPNVYDSSIQQRALAILHSCIATLGDISGVFEPETRALMTPMMKAWMEQFSIILSPPVPSEDLDDWALRMEVLKSLIQMVQNFPKLVVSEFPAILDPLWQTFVSCLRVYELASIQGIDDSYAGRTDSDGAEQSLEAFAIQLFEFLLTIVGNSKLAKVIKKHAGQLVYYTIAFMQMTEEQVQTWLSDANQYVADEDDVTYSCRVSGILLLEELVGTYEMDGIDSVIGAVKKRAEEASQARAVGNTDWWKLKEAAILAFGSISDLLLESQTEGNLNFIGEFLDNILAQDLATDVTENPFLHARAFWAAAKFSSVINQGRHEQFLYGAMRALALVVPPPVKVGACRALSQLLPRSNAEILRPHMRDVFSSIADLLKQASDETLHLVLETLQAAIKADQQASVAVESTISPLVLNVWAHHISDPFISIDAVEVLEAIKDVLGCLHPLVSRVLPSIGPVLANPQQQPTGFVAGALDLLTMLLKNAPADVVKVAHDACFCSVVRIILQSEDHSEMQNATECLAAFVLGGKEELLMWGGDSGLTMRMLLDAAARLLSPDLDSSGSLFVASYILQLILHLPSYMAQHIRDLVVALVARMETSQILGLKTSLLLVFARLVHLSAPNVGQFVDLLVTIPTKGYENSLVYLMSEWTKQQGEIHGEYQIKVTTSALALLLASGHPELAKVYVQGRLIKSSASGIVTRSKAKLSPQQWTLMPLPAKIFSLLANMLIEIQEQKMVAVDEDDEWEDMQNSENDEYTDMTQYMSSTSNGRSIFTNFDATKDVFNEEVQDDDYQDDPLSAADPLNEINLASYILDFLKKFHESDKPLFDLLFQDLSEPEKRAIQASLEQ